MWVTAPRGQHDGKKEKQESRTQEPIRHPQAGEAQYQRMLASELGSSSAVMSFRRMFSPCSSWNILQSSGNSVHFALGTSVPRTPPIFEYPRLPRRVRAMFSQRSPFAILIIVCSAWGCSGFAIRTENEPPC